MIHVLLAAYNESQDLPSLLNEFAADKTLPAYQLIIINDGSTDDTLLHAQSFSARLPITILSHKTNLGLGKALLTGLTHAASLIKDGDMLVTMDADNTHKPSQIAELARKLNEGNGVCVASRFAAGGKTTGVPIYRSILSFIASLLLKLRFSIKGVSDYSSGYRAFSSRTIKILFERYGDKVITEPGFAATIELLIKAAALGVRCAEVPLSLNYDAKRGKSKMKVFSTMVRYALLSMKMKL